MDFRGNRCGTMPGFFSYVLNRKDAGTDLYFLRISCDLARGHRHASPVLRELGNERRSRRPKGFSPNCRTFTRLGELCLQENSFAEMFSR